MNFSPPPNSEGRQFRRRLHRLVQLLIERRSGEDLLWLHPSLRYLDEDLGEYSRVGENVYLTSKYCIKSSRPNAGYLIENECRVLKLLTGYPFFPEVVALLEEGPSRILVTTRLPGRELATLYRLTPAQLSVFERDRRSIVEILRREGIRHRDVTPRNLRISTDKLMLVDFEFATLHDEEIQADTSCGAAYLESSLQLLGARWRSESDEGSFQLVRQELSRSYTVGGVLRFALVRMFRRLGV